MILHAGNGLVLTQRADVPMKQRVFRTQIDIKDLSEVGEWKEITEKQKDVMLAETAIIDVDDMDVAAIKRVSGIIGKVSAKINEVPMTVKESLELVDFFPKWGVGEPMPVGKKVSFNGSLYKVLQDHTSQSDWNPKEAKSLFMVVQDKASGDFDDPIKWEQGMVLVDGKFYLEGGIKYECIRDSGIAMHYSLEVLVGTYVEVSTAGHADPAGDPGTGDNVNRL